MYFGSAVCPRLLGKAGEVVDGEGGLLGVSPLRFGVRFAGSALERARRVRTGVGLARVDAGSFASAKIILIFRRRSFPRRAERAVPGVRAFGVPRSALRGRRGSRQEIIVVPVMIHSPGRRGPFYARGSGVKVRHFVGVHLLPLVVARRERSVFGEVVIPLFRGRSLDLPHLLPYILGELLAVHGAEETSADRRLAVIRLPGVHSLQRRTSIGDAHF